MRFEIEAENDERTDWEVYVLADPKRALPRDAQVLRLIDEERQVEYVVAQRNAIVGRLSTSDIRLEWEELSRLHCRLEWRGKEWTLSDLDSINGVMLNDQRVGRGILQEGDTITLADRKWAVDMIEVRELVA